MDYVKFINKCIDVAKTVGNAKYNVACIIVYRNRIVGMGCNSYTKTHPMMVNAESPDKIYLHAEISAISQFNRYLRFNAIRDKREYVIAHSTMFVASVCQDGTARIAEPCITCLDKIQKFGIRKIFYTHPDCGYKTRMSYYDSADNSTTTNCS